MATFLPFIKPGYVSKDGTTPIYVRYNYNRNTRTLIATGYSIKPEHWDDAHKQARKVCFDAEAINNTLLNIMTKLGQIIVYAKENGIEPTVEFVLLELDKNRTYEQRSNRVDLFDALELYMVEKHGKVSPDQVKDYKSLRKHLTAFKQYSSQPITFRNLNLKFYEEFLDYLSYKAVKPNGTIGLLTNSAGKIIRLLKAFVNYQIAKGVIPHVDLKCFKVLEEETYAIYLTEKELDTIYGLDLSTDEELEQIRDVFIVGCYTGLRYSDLSNLNPEQIDCLNGYINIKQIKVHKAVVIPIIGHVGDILKKYNYQLPLITSYKFNERLKELARLVGLKQKVEVVRKKGINRVVEHFEKWELISSHTCRRSFCTNIYLLGFPAEELMKISGHKSPAAFMRYIKVDNKQAADRLRDHFNKQ